MNQCPHLRTDSTSDSKDHECARGLGIPCDECPVGNPETFPEIVDPIIKRAMKHRWRLDVESADGAKLVKPTTQAIVSVSRELDGRVWVHLSASIVYMDVMAGVDKITLPAWKTLAKVRDEFLGPEAKCILVVAPASEHVNLAEVHHIWHCPEGDGLPDFTRGSGSI